MFGPTSSPFGFGTSSTPTFPTIVPPVLGTVNGSVSSFGFAASCSPASSTTPAPVLGVVDSATAANPSPLAPQTSKIKGIIALKVLIDKQKKRVVLVECNKDFIDVLFSFLSLPVGTILKLVGEKSPRPIRCLNNLYESVRDLEAGLFVSDVCKELLLNPRGPSESHDHHNLKLLIDNDFDTSKCFYLCKNEDCRNGCDSGLSEFPNVKCKCGGVMDQLATLVQPVNKMLQKEEGGALMKGTTSEKFIISDNLQVMSGLSSLSNLLLRQHGVTDVNQLETLTVDVGEHKVLDLLHLSLVSQTPLTHWILHNPEASLPVKFAPEAISKALEETSKKRLTLAICKSKLKVLYAECEEDFIDFVFSFLTFPLGSVLKLLQGKSMLGCIDHLYASISESAKTIYSSEDIKDMLLNPKLAPCYASNNKLLEVEESNCSHYIVTCKSDKTLSIYPAPDSHKFEEWMVLFSEVDPKCFGGKAIKYGDFVKGPAKYMITDDLKVAFLSPTKSISLLAKSGVALSDVDIVELEVGKMEAKDLLKASLISESVLTDVFKGRLWPIPSI